MCFVIFIRFFKYFYIALIHFYFSLLQFLYIILKHISVRCQGNISYLIFIIDFILFSFCFNFQKQFSMALVNDNNTESNLNKYWAYFFK